MHNKSPPPGCVYTGMQHAHGINDNTQRQQRRLEDELTTLRQERARLLGQVAEVEQSLAVARSELESTRHVAAEEQRISSEAHASKVATLERALADARALLAHAAQHGLGLSETEWDALAKAPPFAPGTGPCGGATATVPDPGSGNPGGAAGGGADLNS